MTISNETEARKLQTTTEMRESRVVRFSLELGDASKNHNPKLKSDNRVRTAFDMNAVHEANVF